MPGSSTCRRRMSSARSCSCEKLAPAVLRHRVTVAPELELEGVVADVALRGIIEKIEAPR